ncbi:hypothetical protein [Micromonospora haikouensis]|uniref:hypothetical protein n=1 Tax=Micromonospora haikouensis TaxID=686309 RepID=UPI003D711643
MEKMFACPACAQRRAIAPRGTCWICGGTKTVTIDAPKIAAAIVASRGPDKGKLRRSRPALPDEHNGVYGAAYVWRMIRFHAGLDMHLPMMAPDYIGIGYILAPEDREILDYLDGLTNLLGGRLFGQVQMLRAAARWGLALHGDRAPSGEDGVWSTNGDGLTLGQLAAALGVADCGNGLDVGGPNESPEARLESLLDGDGNLDEEVTAVE